MYWVIPRSDDPMSLAVIFRKGQTPKGAIAKCPMDQITGEPEEAEWLTIQEVADPESENLVRVAVVDTALKQQILSDREAAKLALSQARAERLVEVRRLFQRADSFDKQELVTISDLQDAISDIVQVLRFITENDRPKE